MRSTHHGGQVALPLILLLAILLAGCVRPPPPGIPASFVRVSQWENQAGERVEVCLGAYSPEWVGELECWWLGARQQGDGRSRPHDVECRFDMVRLGMAVFDARAIVVGEDYHAGNFCLGASALFKVTVSSTYSIQFTRQA